MAEREIVQTRADTTSREIQFIDARRGLNAACLKYSHMYSHM